MRIEATSVDDYLSKLPEDRIEPMTRLREVINANLPDGFVETLGYGMPAWVVPHSLYPGGYHCDPKLPLPFLNIASQKRHMALYHMGLYANEPLMEWFVGEYPNHAPVKLDMGKSCVRFKKPAHIPFDLIGELVTKMTPQAWIDIYESAVKR